ncbi:MAG: MBL fold metallo-hydrolase [Planctomycetes bacterium]|nr:MBL fold metallo-hydrolase [Planctomycetota bacterium]
MSSAAAPAVHAIDLMHLGIPGAVASWAVEGPEGWVLVESGPASTWGALEDGLRALGLQPSDLSALLLTHIHLDHAGGAWQLAARGVPVHVHTIGVRHLVDPSRLERSARRIYAERFDTLWGSLRPIQADLVRSIADGDIVAVAGLHFQAIETLGHASHHHAWHLLESDDLFAGDAAAMRVPGTDWITVPMPPPDLDLDQWASTIAVIRDGPWKRFRLTHGGTVKSTDSHLDQLESSMAAQVEWIKNSGSTADRHNRYRDYLRAESMPWSVSDALFESHVRQGHIDMNLMGVDRWLQTQQSVD